MSSRSPRPDCLQEAHRLTGDEAAEQRITRPYETRGRGEVQLPSLRHDRRNHVAVEARARYSIPSWESPWPRDSTTSSSSVRARLARTWVQRRRSVNRRGACAYDAVTQDTSINRSLHDGGF